jgi:hypothetical protein
LLLFEVLKESSQRNAQQGMGTEQGLTQEHIFCGFASSRAAMHALLLPVLL